MYNYYLHRYRGKNKKGCKIVKASKEEITDLIQHESICRICGRPLFPDIKPSNAMSVIICKEKGEQYPLHNICYTEKERGKPPASINTRGHDKKRPPLTLPQTIDWTKYRSGEP